MAVFYVLACETQSVDSTNCYAHPCTHQYQFRIDYPSNMQIALACEPYDFQIHPLAAMRLLAVYLYAALVCFAALFAVAMSVYLPLCVVLWIVFVFSVDAQICYRLHHVFHTQIGCVFCIQLTDETMSCHRNFGALHFLKYFSPNQSNEAGSHHSHYSKFYQDPQA